MAQIEVEPNTVPARTLSDDVYLLAGLLGEVLQSSSGDRAFALTEEARAHAKALRSGDRAAGAALDALVQNLSAHPEWDPVLFPEKYLPKRAPTVAGASSR